MECLIAVWDEKFALGSSQFHAWSYGMLVCV